MDNRKCICFSRTSTAQQDVRQQTDEVFAECLKDGYSENDIYVIEYQESAIKLSVEERQGIQRLFRIISGDPEVDCVYCYEVSRLSRQPGMLYQIRDLLISKKIQLIVMKPYLKLLDPDGQVSQSANLMFALFSSISESEMAIKKARFARGKARNKAMGKFVGGPMKYGVTKDKGGYLVPDETKRKYVVEVFTRFAAGESLRKLGKDMEDRGEFTRDLTGRANGNRVRRMIKWRKYVDMGIVTDDLFRAANAKMTKKKPKKSKHVYWGNGILKTPKGYSMHGIPSPPAYVCHDEYVWFNLNVVDSLLWAIAKARRIYQATFGADERKGDLQRRIDEDRKKVENLNSKKEELNTQLQNIEIRLVRGKMTEQTAETLERDISAQLGAIDKDLAALGQAMSERQIQLLTVTNQIMPADAKLDGIDDENVMAGIIREEIRRATLERTGKYAGRMTVEYVTEDETGKDVFVFDVMAKTAEIGGQEFKFEYIKRI